MRRELPLVSGVLLLAAGLVLALYELLGQPPLVGVDDANIFLTYARNLLAGEGFVYSAGGERVEGFTSLLWVLCCAAALALSSQPERLLLGLNLLFAAAAVGAVASFLLRECAGEPAPGARARAGASLLLVLGWAFGAPSFLVWTTLSLMDTGLFCAVLTLGTLSAARAAGAAARGGPRRAPGVALWVALVLLARPEGLAVGLLWVAALGLASGLAAKSARSAWRSARAPALAWLLVAGALLVFRLAYFGYPLPNTFYAKVSPSLAYNLAQGLQYLGSFAMAQPLALAALGAALGTLAQSLARLAAAPGPEASAGAAEPRARAAELLVISGTALLGAALPVVEGGDHFVLFRAYQPVWPLLALPALSYAPRLLAGLGRGRGGGALAGGLVAGALGALLLANRPLWPQIREVERLKNEFALAQSGRTLGALLNRIQGGRPAASLGVTVTGGIGLTYRGPVVDLMGLNSVAMGHSPGERRGLKNHAAFHPEVFYELAPDLVFPDGTLGLDATPLARTLRPTSFENRVLGGLVGSPRFQESYLPVLLGRGELARPDQLNVAAWCRRAALAKLRESGAGVVVIDARALGR